MTLRPFVILLLAAGISVLVIIGILPRTIVPWYTGALLAWILIAPLESGVLVYVAMIPLFIAIPVTATYDNLNMWRLAAIALSIKWFFQERIATQLSLRALVSVRAPLLYCGILFVLGALSLIGASDVASGIRRILYFVNFGLIGAVVYWVSAHRPGFGRRLALWITIPTLIAVVAGYAQLASTYFLDIFQFVDVWGREIQRNQFGTVWSQIAINLGNTWFAYYGNQLSLRVFSLFPDSHSFPLFVLLGLPSIFAVALHRLIARDDSMSSFRRLVRTRTRMFVLWIPLAFLIVILSGTRGIWAASIGVLGMGGIVWYFMRRSAASRSSRTLLLYLTAYLTLFFILLSVAYPIFTSPQFLLAKGDLGLFGNRIRSIIDFGETSNSQRLEIWRYTLESIRQHPWSGVGIGNYPVVLAQDVFLARAGSSAHNVYLHVAAEVGIPALLAGLLLVGIVYVRVYRGFLSVRDPVLRPYLGALLLVLPWIALYSLTDVAIFDERAFNLLIISCTLALGVSHRSYEPISS